MEEKDRQLFVDVLEELIAASNPRPSTVRGWRIIREIRTAIASVELPEVRTEKDSPEPLSEFISEDRIEDV